MLSNDIGNNSSITEVGSNSQKKQVDPKKRVLMVKKRYIKIAILAFFLLAFIILLFIFYYKGSNDPFPSSAQKVADATVMVIVKDYGGGGTGVIVDKRGYIVTAKHIFESISGKLNMSYHELVSQKGYVILKDKKGIEHVVKVGSIKNGGLERKDVLLLKINETLNLKLNAVKIASKKELSSIGLEVGFLGYTNIEQDKKPFLFINKGTLSNMDKDLEVEGQTDAFYTLNAVSIRGYSGGPVFLGKNGKVIALIKRSSNECLNETGKEICGTTGIVVVPFIHEVPDIIAKLN